MEKSDSELAWRLADYRARGIDPPDRIMAEPDRCEGEMMTDDEVAQYIDDTLRLIYFLAYKKSDRLEPVTQAFFIDLRFLVAIDRLSLADYHEIINPENFEK